MLSKLGRSILPLIFIFCLAAAAKADTVYTFSTSTTIGKSISANGFITVDKQGSLSASDITDWNINFNTTGFTNLNLTPSNSNFSFNPGTLINAGNNLTITAPTQSAGFNLSGNAAYGTDTFGVQWIFADNGPTELIAISTTNQIVADGATLLTFPATFTTDALSDSTSPVPEPSSLLLLGTGSLSLAMGGLRRMKLARQS